MTKTEAHAILDRIKNKSGAVSLSLATQALERLGDIPRPFSPTLQPNGDEPCNDRPCQTHEQSAEVGFSYSCYLDCPTTERTA